MGASIPRTRSPDAPEPPPARPFALPARPAAGPPLTIDAETAALVRELAAELGAPEREVAAAAVRLLGITYALQRSARGGRSAVGWTLAGREVRLVA